MGNLVSVLENIIDHFWVLSANNSCYIHYASPYAEVKSSDEFRH